MEESTKILKDRLSTLVESVEFFLAGNFLIKLYQENIQSYAKTGQTMITPDKLGWFFVGVAVIFAILSLGLNRLEKISKYFFKIVYPFVYAVLFGIMTVEIFTAIFEFHAITPTSIASAIYFTLIIGIFFYINKKILLKSRMLLNLNFAFVLLTLALVLLKYPMQELILIYFVIVFINLGVAIKQYKHRRILNKAEKLIMRFPLLLLLTTMLIISTPFIYTGGGAIASMLTLAIAAITLCVEIYFIQPKMERQIGYLNNLGRIYKKYIVSKNLVLSEVEFEEFRHFCGEKGFDLSYFSVDYLDSISDMQQHAFDDPYVIKLIKNRFTVIGIPYTVAEWQQERWRNQLAGIQRYFFIFKNRAKHEFNMGSKVGWR
jgi:hypothetical protein